MAIKGITEVQVLMPLRNAQCLQDKNDSSTIIKCLLLPLEDRFMGERLTLFWIYSLVQKNCFGLYGKIPFLCLTHLCLVEA